LNWYFGRIALLQKEEYRTKKMIDDTKLRADEIMRIREETETKLQEQINARRQEEEERQETRKRNLKFEQKGRRMRSQHAQEILKRKKASVDSLRHDKQKRRIIQMEEEEEHRKGLREKAERRRKEEIVIAEERERKEREVVERNRRNYHLKIQAEKDETANHEGLVQALEHEEMALIQKLKNSYLLQQQAYRELEKVLSGSQS